MSYSHAPAEGAQALAFLFPTALTRTPPKQTNFFWGVEKIPIKIRANARQARSELGTAVGEDQDGRGSFVSKVAE